MTSDNTSPNFNQYIGRSLSLLIVLSVIDRDKEHSGYSLIKRVNQLTRKQISLRAGTIYPQLEKLVEQGLITYRFEDMNPEKSITRQKAIYSLTNEGRRILSQMWKEWGELESILKNLRSTEQQMGEEKL